MERAELVVIGGGPGGYAAAFHAADLGLDVALVDDAPRPGGVCLHRGCIPSKTLLHIARLVHEARAARQWGIKFSEPEVDLEALRQWKDQVVSKLAAGVAQLGQRRGVRLFQARARFIDSQTVELEGEDVPGKLRFRQAIVATGSLPAIPAGLRVDDQRVMDSTQALQLPEIPHRLLVVGGGYIGLELGSVYAALGSKVTVVELTGGLLPGVDRDLVHPLQEQLEKDFRAIDLSTKVKRLEPRDQGIVVHLEGQGVDAEQLFDRVLVAVGRRPNSAGLGLEHTEAELDPRGFVKTDRRCRTSDPNILAVGDVAREPMLAHKATREGKVAAEVVAGKAAEFDNTAIPAVVFTDPEIAWCGLTETEAQARGRKVRVARFPWAASGRAQTLGRTDGLTKQLIDPDSGRLLGVGLVGAGAGELIAEGVLAVEMGAVARDLADTIHAHPTLSETLGEAAEAYFGEATHILSRKR